jgi:predicted flap endonuclease-1-like 5' DNA nuclease
MSHLPSGRLNEKFIELMEKLADIMLKQGEAFRSRAYQKAQETIMAYPDDIISPEQLKGKPGIGPTIMEKLNEYVETGTLKVLEREKNNPVNILSDVYGIGPKKAKELVEKGFTTIDMLRTEEGKKNLSDKPRFHRLLLLLLIIRYYPLTVLTVLFENGKNILRDFTESLEFRASFRNIAPYCS